MSATWLRRVGQWPARNADGSTSARSAGAAGLAARLTPAVFLFALIAASLVAVMWALRHPRIAGWDQIQYIDIALKDDLIRRLDGAGAFRDALFNDYRWMPPGSRLLALPLTLAGLVSETDFRLLALGLFIASALLVFDAGRRLSGTTAAGGATAMMLTAPAWVLASEQFMSETAQIPATALLLWCLVRECEPMPPRGLPLLTGAALAAGAVARFSFAPIAAVALVLLAVRAWRTREASRLLVSVLVAVLGAWPFYAYNGIRYLAYARFAATWPLDQMPGEGVQYAWNYLRQLADSVGLPMILLLPVILALAVVMLLRPAASWPRRAIGLACAVILVLTVVPHVFGHNQNPRYLVGALPVLALLVAAGSDAVMGLVIGAAAGVQALLLLGAMLRPVELPDNNRLDRATYESVSWRGNPTCDFSPAVRVVAPLAARPLVKFYGDNNAMNHVQIQLAFLRAGVLADVLPTDLSRADPVDPTKTGADLVMVMKPHPVWQRVTVPDPNANLESVRAALLASPDYTLTDAEVGGPPAMCPMSVFVAKHPSH